MARQCVKFKQFLEQPLKGTTRSSLVVSHKLTIKKHERIRYLVGTPLHPSDIRPYYTNSAPCTFCSNDKRPGVLHEAHRVTAVSILRQGRSVEFLRLRVLYLNYLYFPFLVISIFCISVVLSYTVQCIFFHIGTFDIYMPKALNIFAMHSYNISRCA